MSVLIFFIIMAFICGALDVLLEAPICTALLMIVSFIWAIALAPSPPYAVKKSQALQRYEDCKSKNGTWIQISSTEFICDNVPLEKP